MKKLLTVLLGLLMIISLAACAKKPVEEPTVEPVPDDTEPVGDKLDSYADYLAAEMDAPVAIEAYVQAVQSYWNGAKLYLQDKDGAYFVYCEGNGEDVNISEADYAKLVPSTDYSPGWTGLCDGTKVMVLGVKGEWSGEVEILDAQVIIEEGEKWVAEPLDVTDKLGSDDLINYMNQKVAFNGLTVAPSKDANDKEAAFLYNWDGSGEPGNDLYFNVEKDGQVFTFVVESYLCYDGSEVYDTVESLNIGDTVDLEGFLYWYNGANPHITSVVVR